MLTAKVVLMTIVSGGLFAQTQPPSDGVQQDASDPFHIKTTIVVTGTRTPTELQESPVSTSVLTRTELEMRDTRTLDQGLGLIEGLYSLRSKGSQDTLTGVGMRGFDARGSDQTRVLILLDGQPLNDAYTGSVFWATLPVTEVERVEVARGPFSSLYGGNAMGGVVNILTRPVDQRQIEVEEQYGTYNAVEYTLRYSERFWKKLGVAASYQTAAIWRILDQRHLCQPDRGEFGDRTADPRADVHADHQRRIALRGGPAGRQLVQPARLSRQVRLHLLAEDDGFVAVHLSPLWLRLRQRDFADSRCQRAAHAKRHVLLQ